MSILLGMLLSLAHADEINDCVKQGYRVTEGAGFINRLSKVSGRIDHQKQAIYQGTLEAGRDYAMFICGEYPAIDIDIAVTDWLGNLIVHDDAINKNPIIVIHPLLTGRFTFDVIMYDSAGQFANYDFVIVSK